MDYKFIKLSVSNKPNKKYMAIFKNLKNDRLKIIHFGQKGASDYTIHKDEKRKQRYIERHKKNENWNDPLTAAWWSRWYSWEKPTKEEAKELVISKLKDAGYITQ